MTHEDPHDRGELARLRPSWAAILEANRAASQPFFCGNG